MKMNNKKKFNNLKELNKNKNKFLLKINKIPISINHLFKKAMLITLPLKK
jgi:hypothetical protein